MAYENVELKPAKSGAPSTSKVLDLSELAAKYADNVPFRFQVVNGFMAENEKDPTLGVDEVYSVHLVREIKVVTVKVGNDKFKVPVTSAAKFGLAPPASIVTYNGVEAILSRPQLPKVLAVKSMHVDEDERFRLQKDEILLVRGVAKGKFGHGTSGLRVFRLSSYSELVLPKDCDAKFSADPQHTQMYLTDLIDNKVNFIPSLAHIFPGVNSSLSELLTAKTISLESLDVHRSVIVSLFQDNPSAKRKKETSFIDLPTTININVRVVETDKSDKAYGKIFLESEYLLADYNPSKIQACVDASTNDEYMTQAQLLADIRKEKVAAEIASSAPDQYQKLLTAKQGSRSCDESVEFTVTGNPPPATQIQSPPEAATRPLNSGKPINPLITAAFGHTEPEKVSASLQHTKVPPAPQPKPSRPSFKAKVKPPPVVKRKTSFEGNIVCNDTEKVLSPQVASSPQLVSPKATPSPRPVPARRTNVSFSFDHSAGHIYEDLNSLSTENGVNSTALPSSVKETQTLPRACTKPNPKKMERANSTNDLSFDGNYTKFTKNENGISEEPDVVQLAGRLNNIQVELREILKRLDKYEERQTHLERELSQIKGVQSKSGTAAVTVTSSMKPNEVLRVLQAVGLSQYCESFTREVVDGEMFQLLDEHTLSHELGVTSRLHQVRLLKMKEF